MLSSLASSFGLFNFQNTAQSVENYLNYNMRCVLGGKEKIIAIFHLGMSLIV